MSLFASKHFGHLNDNIYILSLLNGLQLFLDDLFIVMVFVEFLVIQLLFEDAGLLIEFFKQASRFSLLVFIDLKLQFLRCLLFVSWVAISAFLEVETRK